MRALPVLTRLLLCLCLLLNGIGSAAAGARMAAMELQGAQAATTAQADAPETDCAGHAATPPPPRPDAPPHGDSQCRAACLAMCLQHAQAVPVRIAVLLAPGFAPPPAAPLLVSPRIAPAPPPVRPPIA